MKLLQGGKKFNPKITIEFSIGVLMHNLIKSTQIYSNSNYYVLLVPLILSHWCSTHNDK